MARVTDRAAGPRRCAGSACWCGGGRLRPLRVGGVDYLVCDACGGELGGDPSI